MRLSEGLSARRRGFTLIELLITMAVLGLLAQSAMSFADLAVKRSQEQDLRGALRQLRTAIDAYKQMADAKRIAVAADESGYPRSLAELTDGVSDLRSAKGAKFYFLRSLPRDPMADPAVPAAATWGLRSYASEPDNPQSGRDVFDVFSRSSRTGMNGRAYNTW
jgi:general secretion pathway protein G